jgi:ectoine hydroxylase-related dioxygenase (phytanoyl-CoA dioxygenase family)
MTRQYVVDKSGGSLITNLESAEYQQNGVVVLRQVIDRAWIVQLGVAVDEARTAPGRAARFWRRDAAHSQYYEEAYVSRRSATVSRFIVESSAAEIAAKLMKSDTAAFVYDQLFVKDAGIAKGTDWHQDAPYFPASGEQLCVIWVPLDTVDREQALEFVRGSHRARQLYRFSTPGHGQIDLPPMPDIYATTRDEDLLAWEMEPGDALVFHLRTFHGMRTAQRPVARRRALSTRWAGDDARYCESGRLSVLRADHGLRQGDPFRGPKFPLAWPRSAPIHAGPALA